MNSLLKFAAVAGLAALATALALSAGSPPPAPPAMTTSRAKAGPDLEDLRRQIQDVREGLDAVQDDQELIADDLASLQPDADDDLAGGEADPEEAAERARAGFERRISDEPTDRAWSVAAEAEIADHLSSNAGPAVHLVSATCRSTLCRVELAVDDAQVATSVEATVGVAIPWDGEGFFCPDPQDPEHVLVYAAREGMPLGAS